MKSNKLITAGLLAVGLVSAGMVTSAYATGSVIIGGTTYDVVYFTGSTAFRANVFNAITNTVNGTFDSAPTLQGAGGVTPTSASNNYNAYGTIGGTPYLISFDFSGSEAGIAALEDEASGIPNPYNNKLGSSTTAVLPGTPEPTSFINPLNTSQLQTEVADLAMADTSQAVSLSAGNAACTDYGIVACVTFEWCKGFMSTKDQSYNDFVNITDPQANNQLSASQIANYFTGNAADQDDVYTVGRNKGSGTHDNTMLDTQHGVYNTVDQTAVANATYVAGAITPGTVEPITTAGGIVDIGNDGFDSGSGTAATCECDAAGATDIYDSQIILLGYLGINDALNVVKAGGVALTLNGVTENDANVINGTYSFWGHEHLYGIPGQSRTGIAGFVAEKMAGSSKNEQLGSSSTAGGSFESTFAATHSGGDEASTAWATTQSPAMDPKVMNADKPSDAGYAAPL
jgi:hypothetical protein